MFTEHDHHNEDTRKMKARFNILVVEDNEILQKVASVILKERGYRYAIAKDGFSAIESWKSGGFDLILLDLGLPGCSGIEVLKEIRASEAGAEKRIPVIIYSTGAGFDLEDIPEADAVLEKPANIDVIDKKILSLLIDVKA